jgi:DeoR/GlpR family transcriptional regulator of sugar metabolism
MTLFPPNDARRSFAPCAQEPRTYPIWWRASACRTTVRRDLGALARDGKLERVHGGALHAGGELGFAQIEVERFDAKDRMGAAAAALVEDGQTVMIDIGTSTLQMARHLHGRKVTVVTTNLAVLEELLPDPDIALVLPGGTVRRNYRSLVGVVAEDSLRQLRADIAFLGTSAVDPELGVWDTTMVEVPINDHDRQREASCCWPTRPSSR